jgi:hypothetical protein
MARRIPTPFQKKCSTIIYALIASIMRVWQQRKMELYWSWPVTFDFPTHKISFIFLPKSESITNQLFLLKDKIRHYKSAIFKTIND